MEILKIIADNPALIEALKKVLKAKFEISGINPSLSDEVLGQNLRSRLVGLTAIEEAFNEIAKYKSIPDQPPRVNEAR